MKINVTFEVKDNVTLREILETGKAYSLLECKVLDFKRLN